MCSMAGGANVWITNQIPISLLTEHLSGASGIRANAAAISDFGGFFSVKEVSHLCFLSIIGRPSAI